MHHVMACAQDTFQRAKQWVKELQRQGNPNIVIALAGNKSDLSSKRKVEPEVRAPGRVLASMPQRHDCSRSLQRLSDPGFWPLASQEAESYASDNGIFFMETSAKTATNVNELFVAIARKLLKNTPQPRPGAAGIVMAPNGNAAEGKKGCC